LGTPNMLSPNFWIIIFAFILITMHFFMIKCNFDVIDVLIFVIYDVQYVTTTYGSKINCISIFVNHKWTTCILNRLIFMFLRVHFKKMCDFVNLLLKLYIYIYIYILSSRFKEFRYSKNDIPSVSFKSFKD
jgi:hypothetical protein